MASTLILALTAACGTAGAGDMVVDTLVEVEAAWQCQVQRHAFPDVEALEDAQAEVITGAGFSLEEYRAFQAELSTDQQLRDAVAEAYSTRCGDGRGDDRD